MDRIQEAVAVLREAVANFHKSKDFYVTHNGNELIVPLSDGRIVIFNGIFEGLTNTEIENFITEQLANF